MHYTVIIPCHNEAKRLNLAAFRRFEAEHPEAALLFVDDGSTDATAACLADFPLLHLEENVGKAEAIRRGIIATLALDASTEAFAFLDADLATGLDELTRLVGILAEKPRLAMVIGSRWPHLGAHIRRGAVRALAGRLMAWMIRLALGRPVYDTQCGAKIFRREVAWALFGRPFHSRWLFDVELLLRLHGRVEEVPLRAWREVGGSKLGLGAMLRAPFELARIVWYASREGASR